MAEEEKKPDQEQGGKAQPPPPAAEEEKAKKDVSSGDGEKKEEGEKAAEKPPPPLPEKVVMRVDMHCEGCARKVRRCLRDFPGVEEVVADSRAHLVVVKGRQAAEDPMKVVIRVQKKSGRKVELLSPLSPPPPSPPELEKKDEKSKTEELKEPQVIIAVLRVHMHCEACAQEMKKRILRMKGVQMAEPNLKTSEVTVKGVFDPSSLAAYILKRTGKQAAVVKQEPAEKKTEELEKPKAEEPPQADEAAATADNDKRGKTEGKTEEEGKAAEGASAGEGEKKDESTAAAKEDEERKNGGEEEKKKEEERGGVVAAAAAVEEEDGVGGEKVRNDEVYCHYYPRYVVEQAYPPQMFSDENPNACVAM